MHRPLNLDDHETTMTDEPIEGEAAAGEGQPADSAMGWRTLGRSFLELFALSGVAVAQPTFDLLSKSPGLFFTRGTTGLQAIALTLLFLFVPATACLIIEAGIGVFLPRLRPKVHAALAGLIVAVIAVETFKKATSLGPTPLLIVAIVVGLIGALLVLRADVIRQFLRLLSVAPVVFAVLFLVASPVSKVVFAGPTKATTVHFAEPKRIVFVLFDEFPEMSLLDGSGHIDSQLYPNFAAFANDATWYRNDTAVAPYTQWAVPAILTGRYPTVKHGITIPDVVEYPDNLFTLLGNTYRTNVHESVTRMCPQQVCKSAKGSGFGSLISQSVGLWDDFASLHRTLFSFNIPDAAEGALKTSLPAAEQFITSISPAKGPELDFAHVMLPHQPWQFLPSLQRYQLAGQYAVLFTSEAATDLARTRHLLQVQATDTALGQLVAKLKREGAYDDSLIVLTADHGAAFTNGQPNRTVTRENYPQIMWTPLFIKYPGEQTGKVDDRPAQSIDILPTVAQVIGGKIPWHVDGASLLGPVRAEFPRRMYQYKISTKAVAFAPTVSHGRPLLFDARVGFAQVLQARAAPPGGDPALRVYRIGEYGGLVGQRADPFVVASHDKVGIAIRDLGRFDHINKSPPVVDWLDSAALVGPLPGVRSIAIAVNGRVAMVAPTVPLKDNGAYFEFVVPPELLHNGKNSVAAYLVSGTANAPKLEPITVSNANF
jgi:hypothetical protein